MKYPRNQLRINIEIVNHCNLNCVSCGHFSPLAEESYLKEEVLEKDMARLESLTHGQIERVELMGGEPLLHPNICKMIEIVRKYFPTCELNICTNGILVLSMPKEFYITCSKYNVTIAITIYPLNLKWEEIETLLSKYSVKYCCVYTKNHDRRIWYKNHRDLTGRQDIVSNFAMCRWGNNCIILENGRLATCVMPFKVKLYNEYYKVKAIDIPQTDSIDIFEVQDIETILNF